MTDLQSGFSRLAERTPRPRTAHDAAAHAAWRRGRRVAPASGFVAVVLVCVLVVLVAVVGLGTVRRPPVTPAKGQPSLPSRIVVPPAGTPLVTEQPMERAAYLIAAPDVRRGTFSRGMAPVVVSADGGAYAVVPWHDGDHGISLSPDGRTLAWVEGDVPTVVTRTVVLTLATGQIRTVPGAPTAADGTAWSDDGGRLLVWGSTRVSTNSTQAARIEVRDAVTLRLLRRVDGTGPAAMVRSLLLAPQQDSGTVVTMIDVGRAVVSPDGGQTAQVLMPEVASGGAAPRLVVRAVSDPPSDFATPIWLPSSAYAEALAWVADGLVVARYGGAEDHVAPVVQLLDPATGRVVRDLTAMPDDAGPDVVVDVTPQLLAVATGVLGAGQVTGTRPRTWPWHSIERVRWWLSDPLAVGLQVGLAVLALGAGVGLVWMASRSSAG